MSRHSHRTPRLLRLACGPALLLLFTLLSLGLERCTGPRGESAPDKRRSLYRLPWPAGRTHLCVQGHHGLVSHRRVSEQHALDFAMPQGSIVCAARGGRVTEVIDHGDQVEFSYFLLRPDQRARIERYRLDAKGHLASFELLMGNEKGIERGIRGKASQQGLDLEVFGPGEHQRVTRPCAPGTLPMNLAEHFLPSLDEFLPAKVELKILVGTMTHPGKALLARPPTVDPDRPGGAGNDRSWLLSVEAAEGAPHLHMTIWVSKTGAISGLRQGQYLEALTPQEGRKLLGVPERGEEPAKRTEEAEPKSDESAPKGD